MKAAVDVRDAFRIFRSQGEANVALQGLTLGVDRGEIVVMLGPSGSGKTTLLRVIAGFERLSAGTVSVFGTELARLSRKALAAFRATNLGFLDQHYVRALSPDLSCRESVALHLRLRGAPQANALRVAEQLLERVGLSDRSESRPEQLSGGEQQRVALCAAVAHRPRLLLVDEPAGELDLESAGTVYRLIGEIAGDVGATVVLVSHDAAAATIADRLLQIRDGRLVEETVPGRPPALVVSRGGWVRLPVSGALGQQTPARVAVERRESGLLVRTVDARVDADFPRLGFYETPRPTATGENGPGVVAELRDVVKRYGERILFDGLSRSFSPGRVSAVVGRSGVGKTTLLHILAGLERPSAGEVVVLGEALNGRDRSQLAALRRSSIGLVMQDPGLVPYLSVFENVALGLQVRGADVADRRVSAVLDEVGLSERSEQRASSLSAGERERLAIARAIAADVKLLLVDEPTARLDEESGHAVARLLADAAATRDVAVVCATHDPVLIGLAEDVIDLERRPGDLSATSPGRFATEVARARPTSGR